MALRTERSKQLYQRTLDLLIEGSSSSSRGPANYGEYPLFMQRGSGSRIYDVDGNEYIDWMMAFGALPLGHAHPAVAAAISDAASTGAHFATATEIEIEVAELLRRNASVSPTPVRKRSWLRCGWPGGTRAGRRSSSSKATITAGMTICWLVPTLCRLRPWGIRGIRSRFRTVRD